MKVTEYFKSIRNRPDRAIIKDEWILHTMYFPEDEAIQEDGPGYYAVFFKDLEGIKYEIVCDKDDET